MSIIYYTIKGKTDGFGAQYQAILSGIAYCNYKKYIYVHTPFSEIEHNVNINDANQFIGLKPDITLSDISSNIIEEPFSKDVHYSSSPSLYYTDKVLEYIRTSYNSSKKTHIDTIDIAIHIRRGDVTKKNNIIRYTDNSFYQKIINKLKKKYPTYTITVFSEGVYEDFKDLGLEETCFKLNTDIFKTFHSLVCSKVLIMGFSSFSYCAGLLNSNIVYHYDTFWHKKLDNWLKISDILI